MRAKRKVAAGGLLLLAAVLPARRASADPWIPAAGHGVAKPMLRYFTGNTAFPSSGFTTRTTPSSKQTSVQLRITGALGLGHRLSLEYDLRGAWVQKSRVKHQQTLTSTSAGLQDQEIGLNYGLTQTPGFAQSVTFNIVIPAGQTKPSPGLGTGRWAVEPDYQLGLAHGPFAATLMIGPRVFLDGGATQLCTTLFLSARALPRLTLYGEVFYVRTIQQVHALPPGATGELYNLLRLGIGAEYRLTHRYRPFVAYERRIAGQSIHAGNRFIAGIAIHF